MTIRGVLAVAALVPLLACGNREEPKGASAAVAAVSGARREAGVTVSAETQRKWNISVGRAGQSTVTGSVQLPGVVRLDERRTAQVSSLLDGKVVSLGAELGDQVRRHQVLATIHAPALAQAKTSYLQAGTRLEQAQREYDRAELLLQQEAIDQKETLRRKTELDQAQSEFGIAESNLHSYGLTHPDVDALLERARKRGNANQLDELADPYLALTSPIDGRVIERDAVLGQHIEVRQTLFTVSDVSTLWAVLDARETDLPFLSTGRPVRITTSVYPTRVFDGRVLHIGDVVDEKSRTVKIRVETRNAGFLLKPNMFIRGDIPDGVNSRQVVTLPDESVQTINGESVVFVRVAVDRFVARPVELGEHRDGRHVVLRGIDGTEVVVLTGGFSLKAELLKSSLAGE
jgi:cobalt-zinc-cadmium efflux system membrane fusion protein